MFRKVPCRNPQCVKKEIKAIIHAGKDLSLLIAWPMSEQCLIKENAKTMAAGQKCLNTLELADCAAIQRDLGWEVG